MTAGEKRKFYRNMQFERSARTLGVLGLQLAAFCPIGLLVLLAIGLTIALQHPAGAAHAHAHHLLTPGIFLAGNLTMRELNEKRVDVVKRAQALIPANGVWTTDVRTKFDALMTEGDGYKTQIDDLRRTEGLAELDRELRVTHRPGESRIGQVSNEDRQATVREYRQILKRYGLKGLPQMAAEKRAIMEGMTAEYWDVMRRYALKIDNEQDRAVLTGSDPAFRGFGCGQVQINTRDAFNEAERRDMGISVSTLGGYFVPQGFVYEIEEAMKYYGDMLGIADILDTATGQPLPYPTDNDTTITGELIAEGQQVSDADVTVGHIVLGAYMFSTKMVKVSLQLLQDSAFDLETYLKKKFALRIGRILNTYFTLGPGAAGTSSSTPIGPGPYGFVPEIVALNPTPNAWATQQPYGTPVIAAGSAANDGSGNTGTNSIGYGDFVNLSMAVDPLYRRGAKYAMHDGTLRFAKTLLDKYGRPLWQPGMMADTPDEINGHEYSINNDMATIAASAVTVGFGNFEKYLIRRVKELSVLVLRERFADYGQVAFIGFSRYDGQVLDAGTHPINYLIQHS